MPSENKQCQGNRRNMGGKLIPDIGCSGWKRFWAGHWCFPEWCRYGCRRGGPEWSWRCVSWKNLSKLQRLVVVQYLESSCGNFEIDSMAYRELVPAVQNWRDVAVPRLLCNNSSKVVLNHLKASKIWCGRVCKKRITIVEPRADYWHGYRNPGQPGFASSRWYWLLGRFSRMYVVEYPTWDLTAYSHPVLHYMISQRRLHLK